MRFFASLVQTCFVFILMPQLALANSPELITSLTKGFTVGWFISLVGFILLLRYLNKRYGDQITLGKKLTYLLSMKLIIIGITTGISYWIYLQ